MQSSQEITATRQQDEAPQQPASRFNSAEEAALALVMLLTPEQRLRLAARIKRERERG